jgi:hypothetical protein
LKQNAKQSAEVVGCFAHALALLSPPGAGGVVAGVTLKATFLVAFARQLNDAHVVLPQHQVSIPNGESNSPGSTSTPDSPAPQLANGSLPPLLLHEVVSRASRIFWSILLWGVFFVAWDQFMQI